MQLVVYVHHGSIIVKLTAVVGRTEDRHKLSASEKTIPSLHNLMSTDNQVHIDHVEEIVHDIFAKQIANASIALQESFYLVFRICPEQVAQNSLVRYIARPLNVIDSF